MEPPDRFALLTVPRFSASRCLLLLLLAGGLSACTPSVPAVTELRVPDGGRMPQLAFDTNGVLHLMYFRGAMTGGNVYHVQRSPADVDWSAAARINSEDRSAIGMGPMDGGDMAIGYRAGDGRPMLHAVWFGTNPLEILYSRKLDDAPGSSFEPQRVLWEKPFGLIEARPTVGADENGRVWVAWHAGTPAGEDDANRAVYLTHSTDGGDTFSNPEVISPVEEGACGCCSPELFRHENRVWVSYRGAGNNVERGQRLLSSEDGETFTDQVIQPWSLGACPVTTTTFAAGPSETRVAWETNGEVFVAPVDALADAVSPRGTARFRRKNPAIATNRQGDTILAWGDAPGYRAGGTLSWQFFDADDQTRGVAGGGTETIASGSGPAVTVAADDSFIVVY